MMVEDAGTKGEPTFCALCISRCGARAVVEEGRFISLSADPNHPTGEALCIKGKVAPELVYHPKRLLKPMKRTRPKGATDPGWEPISWDEALDTIAARLRALSDRHGPECVVFNSASPSTSAIDDSMRWIRRLRHAFGSPNQSVSMELCGWGRWLANTYSFGTSLPAGVMPDLERAGCILYWGYNPTVSRIAHATATVAAVKRGAKLIAVDPRNAGMARRADTWLRVRPGSDGALALGLSQVMISNGWYDDDFLLRWTNAPMLVRQDTSKLLRAGDLGEAQDSDALLTWSSDTAGPVVAPLGSVAKGMALFGEYSVATPAGEVVCKTVFQTWSEICAKYPPEVVETITGVTSTEVTRAASMLWHERPVAYMAWSGVEQQSNATQIALSLALLYALTGSYDAPGGNVEFPTIPQGDVQGDAFLTPEQRAKTLGLERRPLGPARYDHIGSADIYRAILEGDPYRVWALISFGSNLVMAHADSQTALKALEQLDFHVHIDHSINPAAEYADIVLPSATPFETEGLKAGFEISQAASELVQLRQPLVPPQGEARSDTEIIFDLARRLGLGEQFWDGDVDAGLRAVLEPSGTTLEALRAAPEGVRIPLETRHRKFAEETDGKPRGFNTLSRRVELYSEILYEHGYPPLPDYEEPMVSHASRPDTVETFPLVLTCTKDSLFCETQHRGLPSLRKRAPNPQVDMHPVAADARGIKPGDWVEIETPHGTARAQARLDSGLSEDVVCGQHGWWEDCTEIGARGYPPVGPGNANYNGLIGHEDADLVSGSIPMRAYVCQISRAADPA